MWTPRRVGNWRLKSTSWCGAAALHIASYHLVWEDTSSHTNVLAVCISGELNVGNTVSFTLASYEKAAANYFVPRGYVVIFQDVRGRYKSEGHWVPIRDDPKDGFDTAQWIATQPWSDGNIARSEHPTRARRSSTCDRERAQRKGDDSGGRDVQLRPVRSSA